MRISISGSHCSGKSTLIEAFIESHPLYHYEPEVYELLDESFAAQPSAEDFFRQLECHVQRWQEYRSDARVIIERSPVDYLAYLKALILLRNDNFAPYLLDKSVRLVRTAIHSIDAIVFLSTRDVRTFVPDEEDLELRSTVNELLESILLDDELDLFSSGNIQVVDGCGTLGERLQVLERVIQQR